MDERVAEVLGSTRYAKRAEQLRAELDEIDSGIDSDAVALRRAAVRRLRSLAMAELGWLLLPVREYFLSATTQQRLAGAVDAEADAKVRLDLLRIIRHASEAYVTHPMWEPVHTEDEAIAWCAWVLPIAERSSVAADPDARVEAAYLLAYCGDARAWDEFQELIPRRSGALGLTELAVLRYPQSITDDTRRALIALTQATAAAHPSRQYTAAAIEAALSAARTP